MSYTLRLIKNSSSAFIDIDSSLLLPNYNSGRNGKNSIDMVRLNGYYSDGSAIRNPSSTVGSFQFLNVSANISSILVNAFRDGIVFNNYASNYSSFITFNNVTPNQTYNLFPSAWGEYNTFEVELTLLPAPVAPSNLVWNKGSSSVSFTVPSGATTIKYSIDGTTNYIAFSSATSPQTISLANYNTSYPLKIVASNASGTSAPASISISIPSLLRATSFTQPLYLQQLDTIAMFSTILSNTSVPPTDSAFNAVLNCSAAFTAALNNAYRFALPAEVMANQPITNLDFDYTKLLFYQAGSSGVSTFFANPSRVDITQGSIIGSSPVNTVTEDYIKELALFFFGDRKANVMFTNSASATAVLSSLVSCKLVTALSDYTVFDVNSPNFDSKTDIGLLIFKAIVYNDPACFASLTPANALRTFTYPNNASGITYYEYGLPIMAGDSIVIHLQIQPNDEQFNGQAWEPVKTGPAPTRNYSIKLICG
jgi:hypothetical protein